MANEVTIVVKAKNESAAGFKQVQDSAKKTESAVDRLGETTDRAATATGTASGAFGALSSGVALAGLQSQKHVETLQNENAKLDAQKTKIDLQIGSLETAMTAKGADKKAIEAQIKALQGQSDALDTQKDKNDVAAQGIEEHQQKMQNLTYALMAGQLAFDAISGVADLATLAMNANKVATVATAAAQKAAAIASKAWAAAQWLLNAALTANPIGLVIVAIVALTAAIVIAYKRSATFRQVVQTAFKGVQAAARVMWSLIKSYFNALGTVFNVLTGRSKTMNSRIRGVLNSLVSFVRGIPGRVGGALVHMFDPLANGARNVINAVRSWLSGLIGYARNIASTIGNLIHAAVPGYAHGGVVGASASGATASGMTMVGEHGPELLQLPAGTRVRSNPDTARMMANTGGGGGGGMVTVLIKGDSLMKGLRAEIRRQGGNVQTVLGSS